MNNCQKKFRQCENGFSYIDVMIAVVILMIGVIALAATLTANLVRSFETEKQIAAKQVAVSTIESIISARDINRTNFNLNQASSGWATVANVDPTDEESRGIFLNGWTPIREDFGLDGVAGTADDACPANSFCDVEGYQNTSPEIPGFERLIVITDVNDPERPTPPNPIARKRIDISIRYRINQALRRQDVSTLISNY